VHKKEIIHYECGVFIRWINMADHAFCSQPYVDEEQACGRQRHNAKWMAIYNDFVVCHEQGMTMVEIAKRNGISERNIYRYKAYYDEMQKKKKGKS